MAEVASQDDGIKIDGLIVSEQLEGLYTIKLVKPPTTNGLVPGQQVAFREADANSDDRYVGAITAVLDDTQLAIMADLMAMTEEVIIREDVEASAEEGEPSGVTGSGH